jgi:hypothetical protein
VKTAISTSLQNWGAPTINSSVENISLSRLVRQTLSFLEKLNNYIGATA